MPEKNENPTRTRDDSLAKLDTSAEVDEMDLKEGERRRAGTDVETDEETQ